MQTYEYHLNGRDLVVTQPTLNKAYGVEATGLRRAAVIGAGSMGAGIAAQFANAGVAVDLIDLPGQAGTLRNALADEAIARQIRIGGFAVPEAAALVRAGNVEDDMQRLAQADWIVEAILEDVDLKRDLYARIEAVRAPGAIVSSNTSTLLRKTLISGLPDSFAAQFAITHFFNPPRHMALLEVVGGPENTPGLLGRIHDAARIVLGKTVIQCFDTPGFIANRIGCYWIAVAAIEAEERGLTVEQADAVLAAFGIPKTGIFGLLDLIGLDLVPPVWGSLARSLPGTDAIQHHDLSTYPRVQKQLEAGRLGRKSGAGFFRKSGDGQREALDLVTGDYRPYAPIAPQALPGAGRDLWQLINAGGLRGDYAWAVLSHLVIYAAEKALDIAPDLPALDTAVALGYGWKEGPFAIADRGGVANIATRLEAEERPVPRLLREARERGGFLAPPDVATGRERGTRPAHRVVVETAAARLEDAGEGIGLIRLTSKMGVISPATFDLLDGALDRAGSDFRALVITGASPRAFSAGVDLRHFRGILDRPEALEAFLARGHDTFLRLRHAPVPVVAALRGLALGGGCEMMLHCDHAVAHLETRIGLPEAGLGLLPGWGGGTRMLQRANAHAPWQAAALPAVEAVFSCLRTATVAANARAAQGLGYLAADASIVMTAADVVPAALRSAAALAEGYTPPAMSPVSVAGASVGAALIARLRAGDATPPLTAWQMAVAKDLAEVLVGGPDGDPSHPVDVTEMYALERRVVLRMAARPETRAAIDAIIG
jgi:3-hydroxyacyl-CoA dehydrogenase